MYARPRILKLLLFCLWPSWIVVLFDRSILIVLKIGLFVNCVSAKPGQTLFSGQRKVWEVLVVQQQWSSDLRAITALTLPVTTTVAKGSC